MKEASIFPNAKSLEKDTENDKQREEEIRNPTVSTQVLSADWIESEKPLAFLNAHYLEQVEMKGEYRSSKNTGNASALTAAYGHDHLIPLHLTISIVDILNVDPASESFTIKYRSYMLWEADIHDLGLNEYAEKAIEIGHYYPLSRLEVQHFMQSCHVPRIALFNQTSVTETDLLDIRVYGGEKGKTAVMTNQSFTATCRERFHLQHFPFDLQNLTLEFKVQDARTWNLFALSINTVQFHKDAFLQPEWSILVPKIRKGPKNTHSSFIIIPVQRKSAFYVQNVLVMLLLLTSLGLSTFAFKSEELPGRTFIVLTLILTLIAFKFTTVTGVLPKVPYSTLLDHFMSGSIWILALMTVFTLIPKFYIDEQETDRIINLALAMASIAMIVITFGGLSLLSFLILRRHLQENHLIPLEPGRPWYSFRFTNPSFLVDLHPMSLKDSFTQPAAVGGIPAPLVGGKSLKSNR